MKGRVDYHILTSSAADAESVRSWIVERAARHPKYEDTIDPDRPPLVTADYGDGVWRVSGASRYLTMTEAQDVFDDIVSGWSRGSTNRVVQAGSTATVHLCTHDEPNPEPCAIVSQAVK